MAGFWRVFGNWRAVWDRHISHKKIFYLHFFSNHGVARHHLPFCGILDEHKKLCGECKEEPAEVFLDYGLSQLY